MPYDKNTRPDPTMLTIRPPIARPANAIAPRRPTTAVSNSRYSGSAANTTSAGNANATIRPVRAALSANRVQERRNHVVDRPRRRIAGSKLVTTTTEPRCDRDEIERLGPH